MENRMFQISKPTKAQIIKTLEITIVTFVVTFGTTWAAQPDPFSKAGLIAAIAAAGAALYRLLKSAVTTL